jgi:hypothetical protein
MTPPPVITPPDGGTPPIPATGDVPGLTPDAAMRQIELVRQHRPSARIDIHWKEGGAG